MPVSEKRKYDSTVARMAGNIASGMTKNRVDNCDDRVGIESIARASVALARAIVAETIRTEPVQAEAETRS